MKILDLRNYQLMTNLRNHGFVAVKYFYNNKLSSVGASYELNGYDLILIKPFLKDKFIKYELIFKVYELDIETRLILSATKLKLALDILMRLKSFSFDFTQDLDIVADVYSKMTNNLKL